jgi:multimeric flavodoxin WrbA
MKIVTILGSPKKDGTTAKVLDWVEQNCQSSGNEVERIDVNDYPIKGCGECMTCKMGQVEFCAIEDGTDVLFKKIIDSDLILFASPVFCWGFPAPLKALLDRMYCMVDDFHSDPLYKSMLRDKPLALLLTSGGPVKDNAELVIKGFENMIDFFKAKNAGYFHIPFCKGPESVGDEVKDQVSAFFDTLLHQQA